MQGFNMGRYVPPDQEGLATGNKLAGKHALGPRARHLHTKGALIVRFEMPFAVWCTTCQPHETIIGQGVRFNAEKKKVGHYYSTPVYSFRMKHAACGGWIEIRTDPKNTAYVVVAGGRKRDTGEEAEGGGGGEITVQVGRRAGEGAVPRDPFARTEGKLADQRAGDEARRRILELQRRQGRDWEDPYERSRRLRCAFRTERKALEKAAAKKEALQGKMSLGIELVDESEEDRVRAAMVDFEPGAREGTRSALRRPLFESSMGAASSSSSSSFSKEAASRTKKGKRMKAAADLLEQRKAQFCSELSGNTRAAVDPFLNHDANLWQPEVKRRKTQSKAADPRETDQVERVDGPDTASLAEETEKNPSTSALVAYGSDSD